METSPRKRLPQTHRRSEQIGSPVDFPAHLLRRHVRELAFDLPLTRHLHTPDGLRDPEIKNARDSICADDDVLRRDITMNDVEDLSVRADRLVRRMQPEE